MLRVQMLEEVGTCLEQLIGRPSLGTHISHNHRFMQRRRRRRSCQVYALNPLLIGGNLSAEA